MFKVLSDFKLRANQANAQAATGPNTPEGQARSAQNALKSGLRSQSLQPLPSEDPAWVEELVQAVHDRHQPANDDEAHLVHEIAVAELGIERARRAEFSAAADRIDRIDDDEHAEIECITIPQHFNHQPRAVLQRLKRTRTGTAWLLARWRRLRDEAARQGNWDAGYIELAVNLLGARADTFYDDPETFDLVKNAVAAGFDFLYGRPAELAESLAGFRNPTLDVGQFVTRMRRLISATPDTSKEGKAALVALTETQIAALEARLAAWPEDDPAPARARDLALIDTSKEGALRQRYLTMHQRDRSRALAELRRLRKPAPTEPSTAPSARKPSPPPPAPTTAEAPDLAAPNEPNSTYEDFTGSPPDERFDSPELRFLERIRREQEAGITAP